MIKVTIEGTSHSGKTLVAMRIAKMLQDEGVNVSLIIEPNDTSPEVLSMMYHTKIGDLTPRKFDVSIYDTNGKQYNPYYHGIISLKGKKSYEC